MTLCTNMGRQVGAADCVNCLRPLHVCARVNQKCCKSFGPTSFSTHVLTEKIGANMAAHTAALCPRKVRQQLPVSTLKIFAVASVEQVTTQTPSLENSAEQTASSCPHSVFTQCPSTTCQIFAMPSSQAVTNNMPCAENLAVFTQLTWPRKM